MRSTEGKYLDRLDHLRGWAAIWVLIYHSMGNLTDGALHIYPPYPILAWLTDGHTAVSLFLVLSGFVLTMINMDVLTGEASISYKGFIWNRFIRIGPLMIFCTSLAVTAHIGTFSPLDLLPLLTLHLNTHNSFGVSSEWAVGVEFQCYILFPIILVAVYRNGPRYLVAAIALFVMMRLFLSSGYVSNNGAYYFSLMGRADQFIVGIGAAILYKEAERRNFAPGKLTCLAAIGVALVAITYWLMAGNLSSNAGSATYTSGPLFTPVFHLVEALLWSIVLLAYLMFPARRIWGQAIWSWLGLVSYSLYLLHTIIIVAALKVWDKNELWFDAGRNHQALAVTMLVVVPLSIIVAALSYYVIEKPVLVYRRPYKTWVAAQARLAAG